VALAFNTNIFEYTNYRRFLRDLYEEKKRMSKGFSHRVFVRVCGFSSPNFLKLVMDGKRNLGRRAQEKLLAALKLNKLEREYLVALIGFEQAGNGQERAAHMAVIARLRHRTQVKTVEAERYEYLSKWYHVAIRELAGLDDFEENAAWINARLGTRLSESVVERAIVLLIDLGLISRDADGLLHQTEADIVCEPAVFSVAVNAFYRQMLAKATESIDRSRSSDRDLSALTVGVDREAFEKIRESIGRCRQEVHRLASEAKGKRVVYQLNFQLFNLSEAQWK